MNFYVHICWHFKKDESVVIWAKINALFLRFMLSLGLVSKPSIPANIITPTTLLGTVIHSSHPCSQERFQSILLHVCVTAYQDIFIVSSNPLISFSFAFSTCSNFDSLLFVKTRKFLWYLCIYFARKQIGIKPTFLRSVNRAHKETSLPLSLGLLVKFTQLGSQQSIPLTSPGFLQRINNLGLSSVTNHVCLALPIPSLNSF
jgi:hypothetical protein